MLPLTEPALKLSVSLFVQLSMMFVAVTAPVTSTCPPVIVSSLPLIELALTVLPSIEISSVASLPSIEISFVVAVKLEVSAAKVTAVLPLLKIPSAAKMLTLFVILPLTVSTNVIDLFAAS